MASLVFILAYNLCHGDQSEQNPNSTHGIPHAVWESQYQERPDPPSVGGMAGRDLPRRTGLGRVMTNGPHAPAIIVAQQIKVMAVDRYRAGCSIE
jgi:hypothetical protein